MADYFPLIQRAVAALDPNTPPRREAIYARARDALERQLRALTPPIAEPDLAREKAVLETTIRRVEALFQPQTAVIAATPQTAAGPPTEQDMPGPAAEPAMDSISPVQRPKVATGPTRGFFRDFRKMTALVVAIPVVGLIAVAAYVLRDDPARYLQQNEAGQGESASSPSSRKNEGRLDGSGASLPVAGPKSTQPPALPVASRVLFFEETPDNPQGSQSDGQAVWRTENLAGGTGKPLGMAVRGSITITKANISLEILIKKNVDAALPASHTVELVFKPEGGRSGVKEIGPLELRDQENLPGTALQGAMVPVGLNLFLIGLSQSEQITAKNIEVLRDKKWIAIQFRLANGRIGAFLIEKGASGDRAIRDALESWR